MYLSISIWLWFLGIWIVSDIISSILVRSRGLIRGIFNILFFFGVFIHEFSHLLFCFIFRVPSNGIRIEFIDRNRGVVSPNGAVGVSEFPRMSMMQAFMVGIAPLFVSTFSFMICLDMIFTFETTLEIQVIILILAISIILTAAPSRPDVSHIFTAAAGEPIQSLLQFLCVIASLLISVSIVDLTDIIFQLEVFYYISYFILTILIYFIFVLSLRMIRAIFRHVLPADNFSSKQIQRKRHKPKKPPKHEEGSW